MIQTQWPEDLQAFVGQLKNKLGGVFSPKRDIFIARAPARLDVMAGLSDYAGAVILSTPLQEATLVAVQKRLDRRFIIRNLNMNKERVMNFEFRLDDLFETGHIKAYPVLQQQFNQDPKNRWLAHLIGAIPVLLHEGFVQQWATGANIAISSSIPSVSAVASSAALQVAGLLALKSAFGLEMDGFQIALFCQMVENYVVGTPSGITSHIATTLGQKNNTMVLRCQPHELLKMLSLPRGLQWIGINSGMTQTQKDSRYRDLRIASFMGRKIIQCQTQPADETADLNYLCNVDLSEWEKRYRKAVLAKITGEEFIKRYQTHDDPATVLNPEKRYFPRSATEHHLSENRRSEKLLELLDAGSGENRQALAEAGQLLYESHASYSELAGLGCKETDLLVELIKAQGPERGLYGAKASGWGSGGTVVVLAAKGSEDTLYNIVSQYRDMTGYEPYLFVGSTYGALEMGVVRVAFE